MEKHGLENVFILKQDKRFTLMEMFTEKVKVFQVIILTLKVETDFGFRALKKMEMTDINLGKE